MRPIHRRSLLSIAAFAIVACNRPEEPVGKDPAKTKPVVETPAVSTAKASASASTGFAHQGEVIPLADAIADLPGTGALLAELDVEGGKLTCKLLEDKAPIAVANFVGLARGIQPFRSPSTGAWIERPAYDGTTFHRIIKDFMIQGGDPTGTGRGSPGYNFPDEVWGGKHDHAGLLCMANTGPNKNGMQFFITDGSAPHLDTSYTIFGECTPVGTIHRLAATPVGPDGETPVVKPKLISVKIRREKAPK